jgi:hypothetical protein
MHDEAPFNLWNEQNRRYRMPKDDERQWIRNKFGDGQFGMSGWYIWIETANPPKPIPLTIGCMPVMFVDIGEEYWDPIPTSHYSNPRVPDPCPSLGWPPMTFPTKNQNVALLTALEPLANFRAIIYMPHWTIVELEHGDGRAYEPKSLPGTVAGRTTLYHHAEAPFHTLLRNIVRSRRVDPAEVGTNYGPISQDDQNYLRQGSYLSPGCRIECGRGAPGSQSQDINTASSAGVKLRKSTGEEVLTVTHHGFLISTEVFHPFADGDKIGDVINTRPDLDVALVKLTPIASKNFCNTCYFQAETPQRLLEGYQIEEGSWFEVDGMSSGLVSLLAYGERYMAPK